MAGQAQKRVVLIIAAKGFRDEELQRPQAILKRAGVQIAIASSSLSTATGMLGGTAKPDLLLRDVKVEDYDAVVFVGGAGSSEYWNDPTAHALARKAVEAGKVLGAICIAPVTLANADLLRGKKATVWSTEAPRLKAGGAVYTGKGVEVDGRIITADGPASAEAFGNAIRKALLTP